MEKEKTHLKNQAGLLLFFRQYLSPTLDANYDDDDVLNCNFSCFFCKYIN
jgi:hypothetical protein